MNCKRCGDEINTTSIAGGLCSMCQHSMQFLTHCFNCEKLQARIKELEELLEKEEHARKQANFSVVLLNERLKELEAENKGLKDFIQARTIVVRDNPKEAHDE